MLHADLQGIIHTIHLYVHTYVHVCVYVIHKGQQANSTRHNIIHTTLQGDWPNECYVVNK